MAYNETLAEKIRQVLSKTEGVSEKKMFGGVAFTKNEKNRIGVNKDDMIVRREPEKTEKYLARKGVRQFNLSGKKTSPGWLLINSKELKKKTDFEFWLSVTIEASRNAGKR